jgi:arylsulfatase A-like enzyme
LHDIVPTIYEILGITPPREVNGVPQAPTEGLDREVHTLAHGRTTVECRG